MNDEIPDLRRRMRSIEQAIEAQLSQRRAAVHLRAHNGKIVVERELARRQQEFKVHLAHYVLGARLFVLLTAPVIYLAIVPFALLDLCVTLYQAVCFPVYGIITVRRCDYLIFDRAQLRYLNTLERINCLYCSYANGLIAYVREIAGRTEQYWCPIKHAQRALSAHNQYLNFVEFADAQAYRSQLDALRGQLAGDEPKRT